MLPLPVVWQLMNIEGLTRENVASHLQKYRLHLKRSSAAEGEGTHCDSEEGAVGEEGKEGNAGSAAGNGNTQDSFEMHPKEGEGSGGEEQAQGGSTGLGEEGSDEQGNNDFGSK